eukprot:6185632-Pyramimonas_sp.AAC.1
MDGEDFAIHMLAYLGMGPSELSLDCQSTLDVLKRWPGAGVEPGAPRGHLWGPFWGAFEASDIQANKTLAQATSTDIDAGRSTWWGRKANH